jgi:phosphoribosylpyrophosphate synthetase
MVGPYRSLAFSDLAHFLESCGLDRIITLDLHNPAALVTFLN